MQNCFAAIYAFASFPLVTVCKDGFLLFFFVLFSRVTRDVWQKGYKEVRT